MDKAALVGYDVQKGAEILNALDSAGLRVHTALWAYLSEYEEWRLVLSARKFDEVGVSQAYGLIRKALDASGIDIRDVPPMRIVKSTDPFLKAMRRAHREHKDYTGRIGGQYGDRFLEDGYLYRLGR
jgi:hypothetical protein